MNSSSDEEDVIKIAYANSDDSLENISVCPGCNSMEDDVSMIQCDICSKWWHKACCVDAEALQCLSEEEVAVFEFICMECESVVI